MRTWRVSERRQTPKIIPMGSRLCIRDHEQSAHARAHGCARRLHLSAYQTSLGRLLLATHVPSID